MNYFSLGKTIVETFFFMRNLARDYSEPVWWTDEEMRRFFDSLEENPMMTNRFAVALDLKTMNTLFIMNVEKYLNFKGLFTMEKFFGTVHLDYLEDYIKWATTVYIYAAQMRNYIVPMQQTFRITLPLKLRSGGYHWVLSEGFPLQVDKVKNLVSNINIFTPMRPFDPKEKLPLMGDLWDNHFRHELWTYELMKKVFTRRPFILSPEHRRIVETLKENPHLTNAEIAKHLDKKKNNIDVQNKQIIAQARECFPKQHFGTIKDVVIFLAELDYYEKEFFKTKKD